MFINGRCDYIEKFSHFIPDLALPDDWAILTWDHQGQGYSSGERADISSYDSYSAHTRCLIEKIIQDKPYSIIGHSMGCLVALYTMLDFSHRAEQLILISPFLGVPTSPYIEPRLSLITRALVLIGLGNIRLRKRTHNTGRFEDNKCTHSRHHYYRNRQHPCYLPLEPTFRWLHASLLAIEQCFKPQNLEQLAKFCKVRVLSGSHDTVVDLKAIQRWTNVAIEAGIAVEHSSIEGSYHELLCEEDSIYRAAKTRIENWLRPSRREQEATIKELAM